LSASRIINGTDAPVPIPYQVKDFNAVLNIIFGGKNFGIQNADCNYEKLLFIKSISFKKSPLLLVPG